MKNKDSDNIIYTEELSRNLREKSIRGGTVTMLSQAAQFLIRTGGLIILARLLTPEDFGLIGMVMVIVAFAEMFKEAGLSTATIQKDIITHDQISTLFWINVLFAALLGIIILFSAPLVAKFYKRPELLWVTAALSLSFFFSGFMVQHQALLKRNMRFGALAVVHITSEIIKLIVTVIMALFGFRYWSLVGGGIALTISGSLISFQLCRWVPRGFKMDGEVKKMLKFGGHLTAFNFANYFSRNADNILIGKFIGASDLGLYGRAYSLFMLPMTQLRTPITNVALPVLCSVKNQKERFINYFRQILNVFGSLTIPLSIYCFMEAKFLINTILGTQWAGAVPVFRVLALAGIVQPVGGTRNLVMLSYGFSDRFLRWGLFSSVLVVVSFVLGLPYGIKGVATAYTIMNYVLFIPALFYCLKGSPITVKLVLRVIFPPIFIGIFAAGAMMVIKMFFNSEFFITHIYMAAIFFMVYIIGSFARPSVRGLLKTVFYKKH